MIDHSDSDGLWIVAMLTDNPVVGLICTVLMICLMYAACQNEAECTKKTCPDGQTPKLMEHACMCVTEAK